MKSLALAFLSRFFMSKRDKILAILLRVFGVGGLLALVGVFMPLSWMAVTHRWLGLGDLPPAPIVEYLARTLSGFYALFGALMMMMAADVARYRPLVRFLAIALALMGILVTGLDLHLAMPWWWTLVEGPLGVPLGALLYWLARPDRAGNGQSSGGIQDV